MWPFRPRSTAKSKKPAQPVIPNRLGDTAAPHHESPAERLMEALSSSEKIIEGIIPSDLGILEDLITETKSMENRLDGLLDDMAGPKESMDVFSGNVAGAYQRLKNTMGQSPDIIIRQFTLGSKSPIPAVLSFVDGLASNQMIDQDIIALMQRYEEAESQATSTDELHRLVMERIASVGHVSMETQWTKLSVKLMAGNTVVFIEGNPHVLIMDTVKYPQRSVSRAQTERSVSGPEQSFNEVLLTQMNLIRRQLRSPELHFDSVTMGSMTQTSVVIAHIEGLTNPELVAAVKRRLATAKLDALQYAEELSPYLVENPHSLFPQIRRSERVDVIIRVLLMGKVAIMVDGCPRPLTVPSTFMDFYQTTDDYTATFWTASLARAVRLIAIILGFTLPALYIALTSVNPDLLPTKLVLTIAGSREGIPFPPIFEVLIMWIIIEVLREASLRLPQSMSTTIGTVGAIVVGTAVVKAGIVSDILIVIMTLAAVALFAAPVFEMATPWRVLFWVLIASAYLLGIYGIILTLMMVIAHLVSLENFGVAYLTPFGPLRPRDLQDTWLRLPYSQLLRRPTQLHAILPGKKRNPPTNLMNHPNLAKAKARRWGNGRD